MTPEEFKEFLHGAVHLSMERNAEIEEKFHVGHYERWDYDQEKGIIVFSDAGVPKVRASFQAVGTESNKTNTWMWAWANDSIDPSVKIAVEQVRSFGKKEGISKLIDSCWNCDEIDGWEMTALAVFLLNAKGSYRCPNENGYLYLLFSDIGFVA
jgi:hypothetical protein